MAVKVLVSLLYCGVLSLSAGKSRLICQTQTIQREEGDDVALQCRLDPPANLVDYTLDVTRADLHKVVHSYRHGKDDSGPQVDQYRDRTTLTHEDLTRGIITLQISSVQLNDSGPYRCFVPDLKAGYTIVLTVGKSRLICPTPIQREESHNVTLQFHLDPPANLTGCTLDVTTCDKVVHLYRHGKDDSGPQMDQYRGRTTLTHEDLIRGIITLQISSVQLNDSGPYRCYVVNLKAYCTTNLTVEKEDQPNKRIIDDPLTTIKPPTTDFPSDAEKVNVGAIVGVVVGGVVLAALIIGVLVYTGTIRRCGEAEGSDTQRRQQTEVKWRRETSRQKERMRTWRTLQKTAG